MRIVWEHGLVTRPGVEPDIKDVALALKRGSATRWTFEPRREKFFDRPLVPGVGAVFLEDSCSLVDQWTGEDCLAARRAVNGRDRHTPGALSRDAPVRPVGDHIENAIPSPARDPRHLVVD